jgi:hypothetical protein
MTNFVVGTSYLFVRHYLLLDNGIRDYQCLHDFPAKELIECEVIQLTCVAENDASFTFFDKSSKSSTGHVFSDGKGGYFYNQFKSQNIEIDTSASLNAVRDRDTFDEYLSLDQCFSDLVNSEHSGSLTSVQRGMLSELKDYFLRNGYSYSLKADIVCDSKLALRETA